MRLLGSARRRHFAVATAQNKRGSVATPIRGTLADAGGFAHWVCRQTQRHASGGTDQLSGAIELLAETFKRGVNAIGGAPRYDKDGAGQIRRVCELAREFDVDIDMRLHFGPSAEHMNIHLVREPTDKYERGRRVVIGRMVKLSLLPPDRMEAMAKSLADRGIPVTMLPATCSRWAASRLVPSAVASPTRICSTATAFSARSPLTGNALW